MTAVGRFSTRPLYLQVKDMLVQRIVSGTWKAGAAIPNEIELSRELGISVGTVRKALDEMEGEQLISRRQGRGTFVIDQTSEECAIRFSNLRDPDGIRIVGEVESCELTPASANEAEVSHLNLRGNEPVFRMRRVRIHDGQPLMVETSTLPQSRFPGLGRDNEIPPTIVILAHKYGVLLSRAEERVGISLADSETADALHVEENAPLLQLDRVIFAIDGRPVEWRLAACSLRDNYYLTQIP
jgi:GntR family transcriptional regulator